MTENIIDTISKALVLFPKVLVQDNETCSRVYVEALAQLPHPEIPQPAPRGASSGRGSRRSSLNRGRGRGACSGALAVTMKPIVNPLPPPCTQNPLTTSFVLEAIRRADIPRSGSDNHESLLVKLPSLAPPDLVSLVKATRKVVSIRDRRDALEAALAEYGLEVRSDSHYCQTFIDEGSPNIEEVVKTMREMAFYFNKTRYSRHYRSVWQLERLRHGWADKLTVASLAKKEAIEALVEELGVEKVMNMQELPPSLLSEVKLAGERVAVAAGERVAVAAANKEKQEHFLQSLEIDLSAFGLPK